MILSDEQLRKLLSKALTKAYPAAGEMEVPIEPTAEAQFGDYTSTVALKLAKVVGQSPRDVAHNLIAQLGTVAPFLEKAEIAGPGFINFTLKPAWLMKQVSGMLADKKFGSNATGKNRRAVVEFVSANPTGPITLGNGRAAFRGDALSNVLQMSGWRVVREYYVNDWGNQVNILAESVIRRYYQQQGIPTEYPDYCYQGEYINDLAKNLKVEKLKVQDLNTVRDRIKNKILKSMIADHQRLMKKIGVKYDSWFQESVLHTRKTDVKVLKILDNHDLLYTKEEATWFKSSAFGDEKDRVVIKKDGTMTYLVADMALRWNRFAERKFDHEFLFLGADHHGYIKRLEATVAALGFARKITIIIHQFVRLIKDGQEVKISKRAGNILTLEDVVAEVNPDVARFFFLLHASTTHMDFDLTLAKERSEKNPVYYVQYAYARLSSILKKVGKLPRVTSKEAPHTSELSLVKILLQFPTLVREVSVSHEMHKLPFYTIELATKFHDFYTHCRVIDDNKVWAHRLALVQATQMVLEKTLKVMGVSAPEKM